jgi:glutamyl-tRNA synthetase
LLPVLGLVRERLKRLTDAPAWMDYFFTDAVVFDPEAVEKAIRKAGAMDRLRALDAAYQSLANWNATDLEATLKATATAAGVKVGEFVHPARVAATGRTVGASLYHTLEVLGRDRVLARFARTLAEFGA